jgi:CheY-like chemotaxis protein
LSIVNVLNKPVRCRELLAQLPSAIAYRRKNSGRSYNAAKAECLTVVGSDPPEFAARILVAEDNPINQEVVCAHLVELGCDVDIVDDGAEAVKARWEREYDLILMDCQMPTMDGALATKAIRAREQSEERVATPIVALTANAFEADREGCLAAGMNDYMSKPFSQEQLRETLCRWLSSSP